MVRGTQKKRPVRIGTRLSMDAQERLFERAKLQKRKVADLLQEAVLFYLNNFDNQSKKIAPVESKNAISLDYDELYEERRPSRFTWGA